MTTLIVEDLHKSFGAKRAVRGVSFEGRTGEILALLGPNGAGKTTTLRCVAGLLRPDSGTVSLADEDGTRRAPRGAVAFTPDEPDLYPGLTVAEHLRFIALAHRLRDWNDRAAGLLERFRLTEQVDALPDELSHGMRRKVAIIMALLHGARVLILDEPFNGLDPQAVRELRDLMTDLARDGAAVVLSTHRLEETERLADRIAVAHQGRVVAQGTLAELWQAAELEPGTELETVFLTLTDGLRD
ncbi:ABC-2 type transport system ATP-binding protein [Actinomadura pelletieri DSM 43383]|uniref:ABC-2 type transport system ATP-binding protein n=1 Tax=Actinomadura pelletieri DSM 43383 TaxID=1120940 RepID=A0A495Q9T7_9ACTN|nr:ABC transporter ATP-binding protein [Actinomadura pelletieri]RKS68217.1 ABC-2 type transport system ATP-binding protein [Actinomadura pelletieri DSM 43383]